jgi:hypothetical protein
VNPLVAEVGTIESRISTVDQRTGLHSDDVLLELAPGLRKLGYLAEASKRQADRIRRPVLYGSNGGAEVSGLNLLSALYASQRLPLPPARCPARGLLTCHVYREADQCAGKC